MPAGAIYVGRPSPWGNPFKTSGDFIVWTAVAIGNRADAAGRLKTSLILYRAWLTGEGVPVGPPAMPSDDLIVYGDGSQASTAEAAQCMATRFAQMYAPESVPDRPSLDELRGKVLACWCPLDRPCHADILLDLANQ